MAYLKIYDVLLMQEFSEVLPKKEHLYHRASARIHRSVDIDGQVLVLPQESVRLWKVVRCNYCLREAVQL